MICSMRNKRNKGVEWSRTAQPGLHVRWGGEGGQEERRMTMMMTTEPLYYILYITTITTIMMITLNKSFVGRAHARSCSMNQSSQVQVIHRPAFPNNMLVLLKSLVLLLLYWMAGAITIRHRYITTQIYIQSMVGTTSCSCAHTSGSLLCPKIICCAESWPDSG